jgi:hypothetical protein
VVDAEAAPEAARLNGTENDRHASSLRAIGSYGDDERHQSDCRNEGVAASPKPADQMNGPRVS